MVDDCPSLSDCFRAIHEYGPADKSTQWSMSNRTMININKTIPQVLASYLNDKNNPEYPYAIRGTSGVGSWCSIMYICLFENESGLFKRHNPTHGAYLAYLISQDCNNVYLCYILGTGTQYQNRLQKRSSAIRELIGQTCFSTDTTNINLPKKDRHRYRDAIILFKEYSLEKIPSDEILIEDLKELIQIQMGVPQKDLEEILSA